jgi:hypothetical protein
MAKVLNKTEISVLIIIYKFSSFFKNRVRLQDRPDLLTYFNFDLNFISFKLFIMTNVLIVNLTIIKNFFITINYFRLFLILIKIHFVL